MNRTPDTGRLASAQYWGLVFPLGMYTVCTFQLSKALAFEPLMIIPRVFIYLAFAGWIAAATGLVLTFVNSIKAKTIRS